MNKARQNKRGFTLIEMLLVIVIIAILVALLFPAIKQALLRAETAKAKTTVLSITTAFKAFNSQYGYWPLNAAAGAQAVNIDPTTGLFSSAAGNSLNLTFLDYSQKDIDSGKNILDPWKRPYRVAFDTTYVNSIANPFSSGTPATIANGVIVWSCGPDGFCSDSLDTSLGGGGAASTDLDNITSWQ